MGSNKQQIWTGQIMGLGGHYGGSNIILGKEKENRVEVYLLVKKQEMQVSHVATTSIRLMVMLKKAQPILSCRSAPITVTSPFLRTISK